MIEPDRVREIIASGESLTVEFKGEEHAPLSDHDLVEAVVCLANGQGGLLLIGVEDDGRVTGARPRHGLTTDPLRLHSLIQSRTVPALWNKPFATEIYVASYIPQGRPSAPGFTFRNTKGTPY